MFVEESQILDAGSLFFCVFYHPPAYLFDGLLLVCLSVPFLYLFIHPSTLPWKGFSKKLPYRKEEFTKFFRVFSGLLIWKVKVQIPKMGSMMQQDRNPGDVLPISSQFLWAVPKLVQLLGGFPRPILETTGPCNQAIVCQQGPPLSQQHPAGCYRILKAFQAFAT